MEESWVDEHIYQEEVISIIQNLMETPKKEFIDGELSARGMCMILSSGIVQWS